MRTSLLPFLCVLFLLPCAAVVSAQGTWRTDSLMTTWPVRKALQEARNRPHGGVIRPMDTSGLYPALQREFPALPVFADERVAALVDLYGETRREQFRAMLGIAMSYFPMIEGQLVATGLPRELKYLPMAMSGMNTLATSTNGGAGLWMLPRAVAVRYGCTVNERVDERFDPFLSTLAAIRYLKDQRARHATLELAIMAFACGPANLTRAQQRAGGATDMRSLYPHFDGPEQEVLPLLMAFLHLSANSEQLGIKPLIVELTEPTDTLRPTTELRTVLVERMLGLPGGQLRWMNPVLYGSTIPAYHGLHLPKGDKQRLELLTDSILRSQQAELLALSNASQGRDDVQRLPDGREAIYYRVRSGDYLGRIASRFNVRVSDVKKWNNLKNDHIDVGEQLTIYVTPAKRSRFEDQEEANNEQEVHAPTPTPDTEKEAAFTWYTVRSGDSLYLIAKRHPGVSSEQLMKFNGIGPDIRPGQRIKIPATP
jgi:membrane-bound lytic murein transglycosylase D